MHLYLNNLYAPLKYFNIHHANATVTSTMCMHPCRDFAINIQIKSNQTQWLGLENHVCEVLLQLKPIGMLVNPERSACEFC